MRIALVTPHFITPVGNEPREQPARAHALAQALAAQGHRVTIYARRDSGAHSGSAILASGVRVEYVPAGPPTALPADKLARHIPEFADRMERLLSRQRPDVVHAHDWPGGLAALACAKRLGIPVVQSFGSLAATERRLRLPGCGTGARARVEAAVARSASAVLASSAAEAADLTRLGVPRRSISIVPIGVDTDRFTPDGRTASRNGKARLLLTDPRGLDVAVRALAAVPGAELVITGGPPGAWLRSQPGQRKLTRLASASGVQDRLTFTGRLSHAELPALLRSADLLVSMAAHEPSGAAAIKAAACGVPAAASDVGGNKDVVIDGTTGVLVPPGRPDVLARQLRRLLAVPFQLEAFGIAAADRARARYSWARIGRETAAAYARCLPQPVSMPDAGHPEPEAERRADAVPLRA